MRVLFFNRGVLLRNLISPGLALSLEERAHAKTKNTHKIKKFTTLFSNNILNLLVEQKKQYYRMENSTLFEITAPTNLPGGYILPVNINGQVRNITVVSNILSLLSSSILLKLIE